MPIHLCRRTPGTYILLVDLEAPATVCAGRLGRLQFERGRFAYVGSALGPGGLAARLGRYVGGPQRLHWHIDHLLGHGEVVSALVRPGAIRLECRWAEWMASRAERTISGFGSSDCKCRGHLFYLGRRERAEEIVADASFSLQAIHVAAQEIGSPSRSS